jgi:hypothetical protein
MSTDKTKLSMYKQTNSLALVGEQTIPAKCPPLVSKLVPNLADRVCRVVSATDPHSHILKFLDRSH